DPRRAGVGLTAGRRQARGQRFVAAATGVGKPAVVITQCREAVEIDGKLVPLGECPAHVVGEGHHVIHREAADRDEGEHVEGADPWMTAVMVAKVHDGQRVVGKLRASFLQGLFDRHPVKDERVLMGPRVGEDAAVIDLGERCLVATADPITFASEDAAWYALQVNANDIAVRGARPRWFLATLLLPEGATTEVSVTTMFEQLTEACEALGVALVGGHTEVTHGLDRPIVAGTMLGEVEKERLVTTGGAQVGDAIVMTKGIPLEGAAIIAREREATLLERGVRPAV